MIPMIERESTKSYYLGPRCKTQAVTTRDDNLKIGWQANMAM